MTIELIGLREAARRSGRNKGMLHQAMTAGKLPYTLSNAGIRQIDPAILAQLFPPRPPTIKIKKRKRSNRFSPTIGEATALQKRIAAGKATPDDALHYKKIISEFRRKYANGAFSPQSARQFGIA
jgi:hypothetical protein